MIASLLLAGLPLTGGGLTSVAPRQKPIVLTSGQEVGYGATATFEIPARPEGTSYLRMTARWSWFPLVGGQNRSGQAHPGYSTGSGEWVSMKHAFVTDEGDPGLPYMIAYRAIGQEWGPTQPASPGEWIDPEEWPERCASDPTCYWGPQEFNPNEPQRFGATWVIEPGYYWDAEPGSQITYVTLGHWGVDSWPGTHEWPRRVSWRSSALLWLSWE